MTSLNFPPADAVASSGSLHDVFIRLVVFVFAARQSEVTRDFNIPGKKPEGAITERACPVTIRILLIGVQSCRSPPFVFCSCPFSPGRFLLESILGNQQPAQHFRRKITLHVLDSCACKRTRISAFFVESTFQAVTFSQLLGIIKTAFKDSYRSLIMVDPVGVRVNVVGKRIGVSLSPERYGFF